MRGITQELDVGQAGALVLQYLDFQTSSDRHQQVGN